MKMPSCRDGTGKRFCSLACPELTRNCPAWLCSTTTYLLARTGLWPVIHRNIKSKVTTLKFSVHCLLDNKTM